MSVVVINTACAALSKKSDEIGSGGGSYTSPPPASIGQYGQGYDYGWTLGTDAVSRAANSTTRWADASGAGPYAIVHLFAKDPALPNMFGVEVNSNVKDAKITLYSGLFGDQSTTELTTFIHIDPPAGNLVQGGGALDARSNGFTCAMCKKLLPFAGKGTCKKECASLWGWLQGSCDAICDTLVKDLPSQYPCAVAGFCPWRNGPL